MDFYLRWVMLGYPAQLKNNIHKLKSLVVSTVASHLLQSVPQQGFAQLHADHLFMASRKNLILTDIAPPMLIDESTIGFIIFFAGDW